MEKGKGNIDLELAKRLHQALTCTGDAIFGFMDDPAPEVLRALLKNPNLGEEQLLSLLQRRNLPEDLIKAIYQTDQAGSSHRLTLGLIKNPSTPGSIIQVLLPHLHLFELNDLSLLPGVTPDQKLAAERAILQRLPGVELGNKMTLARRAGSTVVGELLKEGDACIVEICLSNARLKEISILQFINGSKAGPEAISAIARHSRWKARPNLQMAILINPKTPAIWYTLTLPRLKTSDIRTLLAARRLNPSQKRLVEEELRKRGQG